MNTIHPVQVAHNHLEMIGMQASAISTLADLLLAVDIQDENLKPDTMNNIGCILEVIAQAMLESGFEARKELKKLSC